MLRPTLLVGRLPKRRSFPSSLLSSTRTHWTTRPRSSRLCGFASVQIKGANKGYGKWVVASGTGGTDSYNGGAYIWVKKFGQSHGRKVAYGCAYAESAAAALAEAGEETYVWVSERLD